MKKYTSIAAVLFLFIVFCLIAGCGTSGQTKGQSGTAVLTNKAGTGSTTVTFHVPTKNWSYDYEFKAVVGDSANVTIGKDGNASYETDKQDIINKSILGSRIDGPGNFTLTLNGVSGSSWTLSVTAGGK